MSRPLVLMIDDQFATDGGEKHLFLSRCRLAELGKDPVGDYTPLADVVFCSGQRMEGDLVINDPEVARKAVAERWQEDAGDWALVLVDMRFDSGPLVQGYPQGQVGDDAFGLSILRTLLREFRRLPLVTLTGKAQQELLDGSGAYLSKRGLDAHGFAGALLRHGRLTDEQSAALLGLDDVVAASPASKEVFREAFLHAVSDVPVLILGETGSGKEILAQYIHRHSRRQDGPFVPVNVAAIPRELVEAELFGTARGAATGVTERPGLFELASGGTLFLDEIGDMPLSAQAKILRVLQERRVRRVGDASEREVDVRLLCATSRDMKQLISDRKFREDLYYRINTLQLTIPPLRERREDIIPLAQLFLSRAMRDAVKSGISFSEQFLATLESRPYPGNVRELENLIRRAVSGAGNDQVIDVESEGVGSFSQVWETPGVKSTTAVPADGRFHDVRLEDLGLLLDAVVVDKENKALHGVFEELSIHWEALLRRLAGACLERCRDPVTGKLNRQRAMQLFTGNRYLKGRQPQRWINRILGRSQEHPVTEGDLESLVSAWKDGVCHETPGDGLRCRAGK